MTKIKKIFILGMFITLPVSSYYIYWLNNTLSLYFQFDETKNWIHRGQRLYRIGLIEHKSAVNTVVSKLLKSQPADINLYSEKKYLNKLMSNLPKSGFKEKKAFLSINGEVFKGKIKLRGDNFYHWLYPQKSWRFKSSKKKLTRGVHKFNFIIPKGVEILNNHLSYKLAKELNLLAPDSAMITLAINNQFNGIKLMAEQIDESFLRKNRRMPNDIYKGDNMGSKKVVGASVSLIHTPSIWEKAAYNNHYPKDSKKPLQALLINDDNSLFDIDSFARFSSFIDLINTHHYDDAHNWIFYYDQYFERMYPIVWDPVGWWPDWEKRSAVNIISSGLLKRLYMNYQFLYKKYEIMYEFFSHKNEFLKIISQEVALARGKILEAGYTFRMDNRKLMASSDALKQLNQFENRIKKRFKLLENYFVGAIDSKNYAYLIAENKIRLSIDGHKMVEKIIIDSRNLDKLQTVYLSYKLNGEKVREKLQNYHVENNHLIINQKLLAAAKLSKQLEFEKVSYELELDGISMNDIVDVSLIFLNLQQQTLLLNKVDSIGDNGLNAVYDITNQQANSAVEIWSNIKRFSGFNIINNDIIIDPGTRIIMDENATVKVLGRVTAKGTKENPIIFEAKDASKPWGAFVLKDERANGSIFRHCIFKDGSGDKGDLYEYTAMLSVHNVKALLFEDCAFYDSHITDDMVHAVYSDVNFKNTRFVRSLADALDVDISNLVVDHCEFIDSGNDAIDLMASNAIVSNTRFINSADKGISIGEGSNLLAANNVIKGNEIGMQSKDTSKAYIYNATFSDNKKAVDAYHKNWRYSEGGSIFVENSLFENNNNNATVGKKSKIVINNSIIDNIDMLDEKSIRKKKIIISNREKIMYHFDEELFSNKMQLIQKQMKGYHE
ncbi:MAG: CotH kinase family protein [gamma proteobacterium symbiont of Taylorina sp.]|nr:CotH kinase family protein [gamma proteobacterium symbiont of Taylorina sp.]